MYLLHTGPENDRKNVNDFIINALHDIKAGNTLLRDDFISSYKPFILKVTSEITKKNIKNIESSDEFSIALSAFNEAIDRFNEKKGHHFIRYSTLVIKSRLFDYLRSNKNDENVYPFTYFENINSSKPEELYFYIYDDYYECQRQEIAMEISMLKAKLKEFKITMDDLLQSVPKHLDSRQLCFKIAKVIAKDRKLFDKLENKRVLPKTEIVDIMKINKKTVERNRVYIIAAALVIGNGFELLRDFLHLPEEGSDVV